MRGSHCHQLNEVPDLLALCETFPGSFPFLLDNAAGRHQPGGHSLLLFASGDALLRRSTGQVEGPGRGETFFARLESWYQAERTPLELADEDATLGVPFVGGWFIYLGYEMAAEIESRLKLPPNPAGLPDALACRCPGAIIVYHPGADESLPEPRAQVVAETPEVLAAILQFLDHPCSAASEDLPPMLQLQSEDPDEFKSAVLKILQYLLDGDVFQVNISRRWSGQFARRPSAATIYRRLCHNNPAPFAGVMRWGPNALLSSSPERLVQIRGNCVQTRPIAGTRPRGANPDQDMALARELIGNAKERAEHIMLIDLERNDLGRVCRPGSIEVNELMVIETYAHVHHIVSNVRGDLLPGVSPVDTIKAVFPGGTITGCPKVRCMEIIAELEPCGRGFYTGSMGYLGRNGDMDLNILIRSMLLEGEQISFRTGAGIVADSDPEREWQETQDKARGLLLSLEQETREVRIA